MTRIHRVREPDYTSKRRPKTISFRGDGKNKQFTYPPGDKVFPGPIHVWHKFRHKDRWPPASISSHGVVFDKAPYKYARIIVLYEVT